MILDATTRSLQFVLSGAITTNQIPFVAAYVEINQTTFAMSAVSANAGQSNDTTAVTLIAAPASGLSRQVKLLSISNNDTTAKTVTVNYNDNATLRRLLVVTLAVGDTVEYTDTEGWKVLDSSGNTKMVMSYPSMTSAQLAGIITDETGSGALVFATSPTLVTPTLGVATATSINFGGTAFSVYTEGSWTPTLTFGTPGDLNVVYSSRLGYRTRIGREECIKCQIQTSTFTHTTASGNLTITGLVSTVTLIQAVLAIDFNGITKAGFTQFDAISGIGGTTLVFIASGTGAAQALVTAADTPTGGTIILRISGLHLA